MLTMTIRTRRSELEARALLEELGFEIVRVKQSRRVSPEVEAQIEELYNQGLGLRGIARRLTDEGVGTAMGAAWSHQAVSRVLNRRSELRQSR